MRWLLSLTILFVVVLPLPSEDKEEKRTAKEALQSFNELIGPWRATGTPQTGSPSDKSRGSWKEQIDWSWKFKSDDAWLIFTIKNGKHFKGGTIRYLPDQNQFKVTMETADGKETEYLGQLAKNGRSLVVERTEENKDVSKLTIGLVGEIRFTYTIERKAAGRKLFTKEYMVSATKEGESLAGTQKSDKPECIVSGGLGTSTVSYKGVSYYVCCTGCRDAFNENPEKYIKEWEEKKAKKK
jgi:hypothetical protein